MATALSPILATTPRHRHQPSSRLWTAQRPNNNVCLAKVHLQEALRHLNPDATVAEFNASSPSPLVLDIVRHGPPHPRPSPAACQSPPAHRVPPSYLGPLAYLTYYSHF